MKIFLAPNFRGPDKGDGGIRRIVEAQIKHMTPLGFDFVNRIEDADLVATHAGVIPNAAVHTPWVVHTHGLYWSDYNWPKWCHNLNQQVVTAMRRADIVTAPSEWVARIYRRSMWLNPTVLYHGVDIEDWQPGTNGGYVLWNKTRVDPVCDITPLDELVSRMPDQLFVSTYAKESTNVQITGRLSYEAAKDFVRNAGVYLATTRETFGIGTIEAMASGVPIVGWAWGGQREIVEHGVTGYLYRPGDYDGLIEGIGLALNNRETLGRAARNAVLNRFTWNRIIPKYVDLYKQALETASEMAHRPKVSVIIPCYNLGQYLPDAVESVVNSTMKDVEIVIVDDASTDQSGKVAEDLAARHSVVKVVHNKENQYLAGALNTGIEASTGRYIVPLDADNMISDAALGILSKALDDSRGVDITYGAAKFVLEDGVTPDQGVSPDGISGWPRDFSFASQMMHRNQIPSTCMYRRKVWERSGGYRLRCRTAEDAEFWTRVSSLGFAPRLVTNIPTLIYRQRQDSMSRVEADWKWEGWVPWSTHSHLTPWGVADSPPATINGGIMWHIPTLEPAKVSVIIPVGPGHEALLIDALDSVEAQTFRDWECIVVNDTGHELSIPHTWATVIEGGVDYQTDTAYHPYRPSDHFCSTCGEHENWHHRMGPARARNIGINAATTPVIVPLDADDFLQQDALSVFYAAHVEFGGVVYSQWWDQFQDTTKLYDPEEPNPGHLISNGAIHAVTAMYSKADILMVGGFDEGLSHWEDWDLAIMLAMNGICSVKIPRPLFTYRKETGFRRESNMAEFDQGKIELTTKWKQLGITQEAITMACPGGCGGNRYQNRRTPMANNVSNSDVAQKRSEGYALVKYNGRSSGTQTYRGGDSGTNYRFSTNASNRIKYVLDADVEGLLQLMDGGNHLFEVVNPRAEIDGSSSAAQMVAPGAPQRIEPTAPVVEPVMPQAAPIPVVASAQVDGAKLTRLPESRAEAETMAQAHVDATLNQPPEPETPDILDGNVAQVQAAVGGMSIEEIGIVLAREKAAKNRAGAKKALTDAMIEKVNA